MDTIRSAMDNTSAYTCIEFEERSGQTDYILFERGEVCESNIGRQGNCQAIFLDSFCAMKKGKVLHELCHALDFGTSSRDPTETHMLPYTMRVYWQVMLATLRK